MTMTKIGVGMITMIAVGNVMMNAARNAPLGRFVRIQTVILALPVVLGVFTMPGPMPKLLAFLILVLLKGINEVSGKIKAAHPEVPVYIYENSGHGFNNDGRPDSDADDAKLARERTLELFEANGAA